MYNSTSSDKLPLHLPLAMTVLLKTWFENEILERGLLLLKQRAMSQFFFYRYSAGCLLNNDSELYLLFEETSRIVHGFTIKQEYCSFCGYQRKARRCEHIAALCILSLMERPDSSFYPMPLLYKNSWWRGVASFLNDWLAGEKGQLKRSAENGHITYSRMAKEGSFEATVSASSTNISHLLDHRRENNAQDPVVYKLFKELQSLCLSLSEKELARTGMSSRGLKQDSSMWSNICTFFYSTSACSKPEVSYDRESGLFILTCHGPTPGAFLRITLPKNHTLGLFKLLGGIIGKQFKLLPPGRQGYSVEMETPTKIKVSPLVTLDDNRFFLLSDIRKYRFGNHYFFPDEGFFRPEAINKNAEISSNYGKKQTNPLFDFVNKDLGFVVEQDDIPDFLRFNKKGLSHPDNRVGTAVADVKFTDVPDSLIIHDFKEDRDWLYLSCNYGLGNSSISLEKLLEQSSRDGKITVEMTTLELKKGPLSWFRKIALTRAWTDQHGRTGVRLSRGEFLSLITSIGKIENRLHDDHADSILNKITDINTWASLNTALQFPQHLRSYQRNGLSWLYTIYELGLGGLLADDMGLGKTHQGLALLETIIRDKKTRQPHLIVCPTSVLLHWAEKIDRFYPVLEYSLYYGAHRNLKKALKKGLIITTYGIIRSEQKEFAKTPFELLLLDEIQTLKNRKTAIHKAVGSLSARVTIGLSGTPIENSLSDLYGLFDICLPGFFGTFDQFNTNYLIPITQHQSEQQKQLLSRKIQPLILRRSRAQVLTELPELIEDSRACELSDDQVSLYRDTIESQQHFLDALADEGKKIDYLNILSIITRLKQICNHPCMLEKCHDPNKYKSGKWDLFVQLLDECLENDRKVVVFSQYTTMLNIIKTHLETTGIGFAELQGNMSVTKRKKMMKTFTFDQDCKVFCSSLLAGGTGIDLIAGQVVIHYDRWWNPAKEEQATGRVHRMGQKDIVHLFRLFTKGTLEEKINTLISRKKHLSSSIIQNDEGGMIKQLRRDQILEIFSDCS